MGDDKPPINKKLNVIHHSFTKDIPYTYDTDPTIQQELYGMVEEIFTKEGYGDVFKGWDAETLGLIKTFKI
jgi:hypothetical protein